MTPRPKKEKIVQFIGAWRKHRKMSQEQLADASGVSQEVISRLERGDVAYTPRTLAAIGKALNCQPGILILRPPGVVDEIAEMLDALSEAEKRRAIAVVRALKSSDAA